jgi:hypothetical protein
MSIAIPSAARFDHLRFFPKNPLGKERENFLMRFIIDG